MHNYKEILNMDKGSLIEVESLIILASDLEYISGKYQGREINRNFRDCQDADCFSETSI